MPESRCNQGRMRARFARRREDGLRRGRHAGGPAEREVLLPYEAVHAARRLALGPGAAGGAALLLLLLVLLDSQVRRQPAPEVARRLRRGGARALAALRGQPHGVGVLDGLARPGSSEWMDAG